jgi:XTP/dITP diphosphohydrolase
MKKIVLASGNAGKVRELNHMLTGFSIEVVPQTQFKIPEAIEDGLSFVENAIIKARHAAKLTGLPAIADDSGIEVDALNHAPGLYSARYAGEGANDQKNNDKLLRELAGVAEADRTARYQCVLVFMRDGTDPMPIIAQGSLEGRILESPRGSGGFGYDPLFWLPDHGCTAAEISLDEKNKISHRAKAMHVLIRQLTQAHII